MDCEVQGYFYNPNIHPLLEFRRRLKAARVLGEAEKFPIAFDEEYGLRKFLKDVDYSDGGRCRDCYEMRLVRTAEYARANGFDAFTTTLLVSHEQDNELLMVLGRRIAAGRGLEFYGEDLRYAQARGRALAKKRSLYRQQYCGCIFSEYERYKDTGKYL
jgi:predicted adenine nucleotide alpha hydrolase (AANH) superfamily ATPase